MTTERIDIVVREDGSRVVKRNIADIGNAADDTANSLNTMRNILLTLASAATITGLIRMADAYTNIQNKLRLVTTGTENLARVTKELHGIANETRSDFEATSELYARLANSSKELGVGQKQLLDFTKTLNQAIVLSGASAEEAAGGIRQLAQGMASGTLRGDELNSVMENFPKVADIIAQGLGVTRGELRKLGAEGKITAKDIIEAFQQAEKAVGEDFAKTVPTVAQSLTVFRNNFMIWVGEMDQALGITQSLSKFIIMLSNNLDTLIPILMGVGVAIGVAFAPGIIASFASQIRGLWLLLAANPFVALAAAIAGIVTTLYFMRDEIKLGIDDTTTLGDLMRAAWESIGPLVQMAADAIAAFFSWLGTTSSGTFGGMINDLVGYEHANESMWMKILRVVLQVFDMIGGTIRGVMAGINAVVMSFVDAWINNFKQLGNVVSAIADGDIEGIKAALKSNADGYAKAGTSVGDTFAKAFQAEVQSQQESGLEAQFDALVARAKEIGAARKAAEGAGGGLAGASGKPPPPPVDPEAAAKAARELARLQNALQGVLDAANPVAAAERQLAEAQEILNKAVGKGLISVDAAKDAYADLKEMMADQLDPLAAVNRHLNENIELLKMSADQSKIEADLLQIQDRLRRDGIKLTTDEVAGLRAKLTVEQELTRIAQIRDDLERDSQARRSRDAMEQIKTAGGMVGSGAITQGDAISSLSGSIPGLDKTQEMLDAQVESYTAYYAQIDELRNQELISEQTASQLRIGIWQMEQTAKLSMYESTLGAISTLMLTTNKKTFAVGKAAAIAQAVINTYLSATKAMAEVPYPFNFVAAGAAVVAGMANVAKIRAQQPPQYRTGGSFVVGGHGGQDSQDVHLRASPGERININTPAQARALERAGEDDRNIVGRPSRAMVRDVTINVQGIVGRDTPDQIARKTRREGRKEYDRSGVK